MNSFGHRALCGGEKLNRNMSSSTPQGLDRLSAQRDCEEYTWGNESRVRGCSFLGGGGPLPRKFWLLMFNGLFVEKCSFQDSPLGHSKRLLLQLCGRHLKNTSKACTNEKCQKKTHAGCFTNMGLFQLTNAESNAAQPLRNQPILHERW